MPTGIVSARKPGRPRIACAAVVLRRISPAVLKRALAGVNRGWRLHCVQALSRRATALQIRTATGAEQELILLTHGERDLARNPHSARDEYRLLRALHGEGLPVAMPLHLDTAHAPPFFITARLPGAVKTTAPIEPLAEALQTIHAVDWRRLELGFLPRARTLLNHDLETRGQSNRRIQGALHAALPKLRENPTVLLHGDFWLGNLLWEARALRGIIDWEDAMLGDPLADLGKCRLELLWAQGKRAMTAFTTAWLAQNPALDACNLPFWDLWGALRLAHFADFAQESQSVSLMQAQYEGFVDAALAQLTS